jgi:hypothetical protein
MRWSGVIPDSDAALVEVDCAGHLCGGVESFWIVMRVVWSIFAPTPMQMWPFVLRIAVWLL